MVHGSSSAWPVQVVFSQHTHWSGVFLSRLQLVDNQNKRWSAGWLGRVTPNVDDVIKVHLLIFWPALKLTHISALDRGADAVSNAFQQQRQAQYSVYGRYLNSFHHCGAVKLCYSNFGVKAFRMEKNRVELQSQFSSFSDFKPHQKVFGNTNID